MIHSLATRREFARRGYDSYNLRGNLDAPLRHGIRDPELTYCWYTGQAAARQNAGLFAAYVSVREDNWIGRGLTVCKENQLSKVEQIDPAQFEDIYKSASKRRH